MAYILLITEPGQSDEAWLLDGEARPYNVTGNVGGAAIPVVKVGQNQKRARDHVARMRDGYDVRTDAAKKVAAG